MPENQDQLANPPPHSKSRYSKGGTYARMRRETVFDTSELAHKLKHEVTRYCMNEKYVPKRWRYINGKQAIDYAARIRELVIYANEIELGSERQPHRETAQKDALVYCHLLELQLMDIAEECDGATYDNMRAITDLLSKLYGKIKNWIKSDSSRLREKE